MSIRKTKLSQKLTLRFRDISMPDESAAADLLNEEPDPSSSAETFDSLPDILPYVFQSQSELAVPDLTYFVSDCSTYKLWESWATNVIPLASQNEEAEHWPSNGTHARGISQLLAAQNEEAEHWLLTSTQTRGIHSESTDDAHKHLKYNDKDSVNEVTKTGVRENLRRVQAFSPYTSILYEKGNLDGLSVRESAHDDVACDAAAEIGRQQNPIDIDNADANLISVDSYLILEEDTTKVSLLDQPTDADETIEQSRFSSMNETSDGLENIEKHPEVKKQSTRRKSADQTSNFPKEFRKQKRSTPRRRDQPSASTHLVRKLYWLSDTEHDSLDDAPGARSSANIIENKESKISTRKTRKSVSVTTVTTLFSKPLASQPRSRRGRKKIHSDRQPPYKEENDEVIAAGRHRKCTREC